jgi:hypothetical protein
MLKIENIAGRHHTIIRLIGRLCAESLGELRAQIETARPGAILEMDQVTLVDVEVVRFLCECEARGIKLRRCSPYIHEWITQERRAAVEQRRRSAHIRRKRRLGH